MREEITNLNSSCGAACSKLSIRKVPPSLLSGTLYIDDLDDRGRHVPEGNMASGLQHRGITCFEEFSHQGAAPACSSGSPPVTSTSFVL